MRWRWRMRAYYEDDVQPPKRPGELAIEVGGVTRDALRPDVEAAEAREDVGRVEVFEVES